MKNWSETKQLYTRLVQLLAEGRTAVLATIIRVEGSAYRGPGAKILIEEDGAMLGNISGGCLEGDVRERALTMLTSGPSFQRVEYHTGDDDDTVWGLGLGCGGSLELVLQHITEPAGPEEVLHKMQHDEPFSVRMEIDDLFVDHFDPPPILVACGADDGAIPLVRYAAEAGFRVTVVDHRPAFLTPERFPRADQLLKSEGPEVPRDARTYVVVRNHHLQRDREWLTYFLQGETRYIGVLGPRERRDQLLEPIPVADHHRVYGPVGLDIGADGHEQIALSILAEMLAVHHQRAPAHLRDRDGPIHPKETNA